MAKKLSKVVSKWPQNGSNLSYGLKSPQKWSKMAWNWVTWTCPNLGNWENHIFSGSFSAYLAAYIKYIFGGTFSAHIPSLHGGTHFYYLPHKLDNFCKKNRSTIMCLFLENIYKFVTTVWLFCPNVWRPPHVKPFKVLEPCPNISVATICHFLGFSWSSRQWKRDDNLSLYWCWHTPGAIPPPFSLNF